MVWWTLACSTPPEPAPRLAELAAATLPPLDLGSALPPVSMAPTPLAPGLDLTVTVRTLLPLENAYLTWSRARGEGPCPARLAGTCVDLLHPAPLVGPGSADLSYTASITTPWTLADGPVALQVVVFRLDGTVAKTPVVVRPVFDPAVVRVGDVTVASAADVAALAGVQAITGSLTIEALDAVSLPDLVQLGGDLVVWEDDALETLSFPALKWVGGDLSLYDDPGLTSLAGFQTLEAVGGTLSLNRMEGLTATDGLASLRIIGDTLYVYHDVNLATLHVPALTTVGGAVALWEDYALTQARFHALSQLGTKLDLYEDTALTSLEFPALTRLGAYELHHCDAMTGVGHFPALQALTGLLTLQYDPALVEVDGLGGVTTMGAALVRYDNALGSLAGLSSLDAVSGSLEVTSNHGLTALDLASLRVAGDLSVSGNDILQDLGLPALETVTGTLQVTDNPLLSQCAAEALFTGVAAGAVVCGGNLDDGCTDWCLADTGP